jgi:hypothetical protein
MAEAIAGLVSDTETQLVRQHYVVIYAPSGRTRKRFPANCVQVCVSEAEARAAARPEAGYLAAVASGPSRSSEGFQLFYLVRWLG